MRPAELDIHNDVIAVGSNFGGDAMVVCAAPFGGAPFPFGLVMCLPPFMSLHEMEMTV
jgi:hypothetical protein